MRSSFRQTRGWGTLAKHKNRGPGAVPLGWERRGLLGLVGTPMSQQSNILISCFLTSLKQCYTPDGNRLREAVTVIVVPFDELDLKQSSLTHKQNRKKPSYLET